MCVSGIAPPPPPPPPSEPEGVVELLFFLDQGDPGAALLRWILPFVVVGDDADFPPTTTIALVCWLTAESRSPRKLFLWTWWWCWLGLWEVRRWLACRASPGPAAPVWVWPWWICWTPVKLQPHAKPAWRRSMASCGVRRGSVRQQHQQKRCSLYCWKGKKGEEICKYLEKSGRKQSWVCYTLNKIV